MSVRIGIDVGGTFTDVTAFDDGRQETVLIKKYSSNPVDPMTVMEDILKDLQEQFGSEAVNLILHGSTAALNTLLEDKGVNAGLLTTKGFRDVYEIGRQWRGDDVFNIFAPAPKMLVERDRIYEARGRLDFQGREVEPLNREDVAKAVRALLDKKVEAVAVCFLFSYASDKHEREAADIIREIAPHLYVSLSSRVNPEWREYERTASTVANAYIGPPVFRYLDLLQQTASKRFPNCRTLMMKSDGGAASARMLFATPIQTVMSGPVAGVIGARSIGDTKGLRNLITFDVGGTSSDMAVLPGEALYKSEVSVGRHPLRTQTVDIETIGAGGGSIASVELGGVLKVGPRSAGARPGPACYGRGGTEPTLTDALVAIGHLSPSGLLDGKMDVSAGGAEEAVRRHLCEPLGMSLRESAWGVLTVLVSNCVSAMRTITVERGYDPREFTLLPFGGMGPTIAGKVAAELGAARILVPRDPGAFSAWGMLMTDVRQDRSLTRVTPINGVALHELETAFRDLEQSAAADLLSEGFPAQTLTTIRSAGMRYSGQSYEVSVPAFKLESPEDLEALARAFHATHERRYGHKAESEAVEIVNFKVAAVSRIPKPEAQRPQVKPGRLEPVERREVYFGGEGMLSTPIYARSRLAPGTDVVGPAILMEMTSTTIIYPGQTAIADEYLNLEISVPMRE